MGNRLFSILIIITLIVGCKENTTTPRDESLLDEIASIDEVNKFEVVTWNIERFPKNNFSDDYLKELIDGLGADVYLFQEIQTSNVFARVIGELDKYNYFVLSNSTGQKQGIVYKKDTVNLLSTNAILADSAYYFASRPPLLAKIEWEQNGVVKELSLINIHYKCCGNDTIKYEKNEDGSWDEEYRRLRASESLHDYITNNLSDENVIVAGDWNDAIQEPENTNVFQIFIEDTDNFKFADMEIAMGDQENWSWQGWSSSYPAIHFDHILINRNLFDEYQNNATISTIKVEEYFENGSSEYDENLSDHRPVYFKFKP